MTTAKTTAAPSTRTPATAPAIRPALHSSPSPVTVPVPVPVPLGAVGRIGVRVVVLRGMATDSLGDRLAFAARSKKPTKSSVPTTSGRGGVMTKVQLSQQIASQPDLRATQPKGY